MNIGEMFQNVIAAVTGLKSQLTSLSEQVAELKQSNGGATVELEAKTTEIADLKAKLEAAPKPEAVTTLTEEVATLKATIAGEPQRINAALAAELAKAGHPPIKSQNQNSSGSSVEDQILNEQDPVKRTQLYRQHKNQIRR
jgi:hypothetical protein